MTTKRLRAVSTGSSDAQAAKPDLPDAFRLSCYQGLVESVTDTQLIVQIGDQRHEVAPTAGCSANDLMPGDMVLCLCDQDRRLSALTLLMPVGGVERRAKKQAHVQLSAQESLELRCGDARIVLDAKGNVQIHAANIVSDATNTHQLLGGSLKLN